MCILQLEWSKTFFINKNKMPNDCWNYLTITADEEELAEILKEEFKDNSPDNFTILQRGKEAVSCKMWSAWHPNFVWMEGLLEKYPTVWVKNTWSVEDGEAGVWVGTGRGGTKSIRQLTWEDMSIEEEFYRFR
jgi:hypothetical protein